MLLLDNMLKFGCIWFYSHFVMTMCCTWSMHLLKDDSKIHRQIEKEKKKALRECEMMRETERMAYYYKFHSNGHQLNANNVLASEIVNPFSMGFN